MNHWASPIRTVLRSDHDPSGNRPRRRFPSRLQTTLPDLAALLNRGGRSEEDGAGHEQSIIAVSSDHRKVKHWGLVLSAAGIPHIFRRSPEGWRVVVPGLFVDEARRQLRDFERENEDWPPPPREHISFAAAGSEHPPTVFLIGLLAVFYAITGPWALHSSWFEHGALVRSLVVDKHQWWRAVTALTLHADLLHLLGNIVIGGVLVHLVCLQIGAGLGWLGVLAAGVGGNSLNILFRSAEHRSVGFSTAVFAAVGILCGLKTLRLVDWKDLLAPLGAGVALLAMLGTSGERVDFGAHIAGLGCGLTYGIILARLPMAAHLSTFRVMPYVPFGLLFLIVWCWRVALAG